MTAALFWLFAGVTVGGGVGVVLVREVVRAATCLLFALVGVAGLFFLLNAEFLAAVQLVVYTGGILILLIFGVMLTSTSQGRRFAPSAGEVVVAGSAAVVLVATLSLVAVRTPWPTTPDPSVPTPAADVLGQALLGDYVVPFEVASLLLLVVMIGAAYLGKGRRQARPAGPGGGDPGGGE